jgi:hypothetical protein
MDGAFDRLSKLETLNLGINKKLVFGEKTFGSTNIQNLILTGCNLKSLPNGLLKNMS